MTAQMSNVVRTLRPSPVAFLILGALLLPFLATITIQYFVGTGPSPVPFYKVCAIAFALIAFVILRMRITVTRESLIFSPGLGFTRRARFEDITFTEFSPAYSWIHLRNKSRPLIIRLTAFRREDVEWLSVLPDLKVVPESAP